MPIQSALPPSDSPEPIDDSLYRNTSVDASVDNEDTYSAENGGTTPTLNDVASLKQGIIKNNARCTVLLVGETGVGKSSALEFIANVLAGNSIHEYNFGTLQRADEQGHHNNPSQSNSGRFYEFTSDNGIMVRVLDTPGLADTRGIQQDGLHKRNIATDIKDHIESVTAILFLANGAVPRVTVGSDYALSTLSAIFPKSLARNTAFMFTNVSDPLHWNFSRDTLPEVLQDAPQFLLDNPVALKREYSKLKDPNMNKERAKLRNAMKVAEQNALETLVELFDWLDGLRPQSVTGIVSLYEHSQLIEATITNALALMNQAAEIEAKIEEQLRRSQRASVDMEACSNKPLDMPAWKQQPVPNSTYLCNAAGCHSNCHSSRLLTPILRLLRLQCTNCNHPHYSHSRTRHMWVKEDDTQASADENVKKWEAAKAEKEETELLIATGESALRDLNDAMKRTIDELARRVEDYAALSLSGPFSVHMEKATRLLEQRYTDMEQKGSSKEQLEKVKDSLALMKRKLELVVEAEEKAQKEM